MEDTNEVMSNPDFLALGLGGANMMAMLWSVAMGRQAVGVEMRGDPFLGVHWNLRVDLYHQLGLIDQMMLERYGEERIPRRKNGQIFRLAECFYSPDTTAGDVVADEVIDGFDTDQHIVGTIRDVEFIDDRWRDGLPNRVITVLDPPIAPDHPDPQKIRTNMAEVLDGPSTFQAEAASIQKLLRRYLEQMEQQDRENHRTPRVQLFTHHRVVPAEGDGIIHHADGRKQIRIETLTEFNFKGQFVRVRKANSETIDLGIPELFVIAEGFNSADAKRLGFEQHDVKVDHGDGRGLVVEQADFLAGLVEVLVGGRLRRRISSVFDETGKEYWVRQIAVGHENDPEVGWVLVQVPDFKAFDPFAEGLLPEGTDPASPEFFAAFHQLTYDYYVKQAAEILEISPQELSTVQMIYGPTLFSLIERVGDDSLVAANGVVAGDSFGNGHFLTSSGAMTGMIGHSYRILQYWQARDAGTSPTDAIRKLADSIKEDTHAWLQLSATEYSQAAPINFGAERIEQINKASGVEADSRANFVESARRQRHSLIPLDPSNWRRLYVRNGRVLSALPELVEDHPLQRPDREASLLAVMRSLPFTPGQGMQKSKAEQGAPEDDKTVAIPPEAANQMQGKIDKIAQPAMQQIPIEDQKTVVISPSSVDKILAIPPSTINPIVVEDEKTLIMPQGLMDQILARNIAMPAPAAGQAAAEGNQSRLTIGIVRPERAKTYAFLDIQQNGGGVQRIAIKANPVTIGRIDPVHGIAPEVDLTPFDISSSVSRRHARIRLERDRFSIEDLKSRNKTHVGESVLNPNEPRWLCDGDTVSFGSVRATFRLLGTTVLPTPWSQS